MKLPVFKAFGAVFAFVFGNIGEIIRIVWLPFLLLYAAASAAAYYLYLPILPKLMEMSPGPRDTMDPQAALEMIRPMFQFIGILFLAVLIFVPMIRAGLLRFIVRGERASGFFYLRYGGDELRILGTIILTALLMIGIVIAGQVAIFAIAFGVGAVSEPAAGIVTAIATIAFCIALIWIVLRLSLVMPASIGARQIGIGPSWSTTKGNAWQLLGYWLLWFVLLIVLYIVCVSLFMAGYAKELMELMQSVKAGGDTREANRLFFEHMMETMPKTPSGWAIMAAIQYVIGIIGVGFASAMTGIPYRLLSEGGREGQA